MERECEEIKKQGYPLAYLWVLVINIEMAICYIYNPLYHVRTAFVMDSTPVLGMLFHSYWNSGKFSIQN
jgi:hypothetical protein